jgi:uncharacterized protein DUF6899
MPYITRTARQELTHRPAETAGELNFVISCAIENYLAAKGLSYATINDVMGALEGAKLEFYRRVAAPYEDKKLAANGDVYNVR